MKHKPLWEYLTLNKTCSTAEADDAYLLLAKKTRQARLAWKVLRDPFYSKLYKQTQNVLLLKSAGFFCDTLKPNQTNYYNLNFLTTPIGKLLNNMSKTTLNPVVLVSTGGFSPLHDGHVAMMQQAKTALEKSGSTVIGGYFSPSHDAYVCQKPFACASAAERIEQCNSMLDASSWLMTDPWESLYNKTYINFTQVIARLQSYLSKHVNRRIKVAYVFGSDNACFMHAFKHKGMGVCLERAGYEAEFLLCKSALESKNCVFVKNNSKHTALASRDMRQNYANAMQRDTTAPQTYLLRNEGLLPLLHLSKHAPQNLLKNKHNMLYKSILNALTKALECDFNLHTIMVEKQLEYAKLQLQQTKTISLDPFFKGTFNLELSRLFDLSGYQGNYISMVGRVGSQSLEKQMQAIPKGSYTLVDDDSISGRTIKAVRQALPIGVNVSSVFLLSSLIASKPADVVDLRDFIVGSQNGGLVVQLPNGKQARAPYVAPYVSLSTRASMHPKHHKNFSKQIWQANLKFYATTAPNAVLADCDSGFIALMQYVGFNATTKLTEICNCHIKWLKGC